jgi:hypothetical protein
MTEEDWMPCIDPVSMLHEVRRFGPGERKVRLFNAAICRRFWNRLPDASRAILAESESLADGLSRASSSELNRRANDVVSSFDRQYPHKEFPSAEIRIRRDAAAAVCYAVIPNELFGAIGYFWDIDPAEKEPQTHIIRDIFGNPFRPMTVDPSWLAWNNAAVSTLAQSIYDERAFDRLPLLADALAAAGCTNEEILAHCRSGGEHVRGCWLVDLVLGKE